ncbi:MAG: hypothetical protein EON55_27845, partial [Alphaproteobacteria bacterium]
VFDARVLGITPIDLRTVPRRIGVAGGPEKIDAIRASMQGGWINVLITDARTVQELLQTPSPCRSS